MSASPKATRAAQPPTAARASRAAVAPSAAPPGMSPLGDVGGLQRQLGNRTVGGMVQRCGGCAAGGPKCAKCAEEEARSKSDAGAHAARLPRAPSGAFAVPSLAREILQDSGQPLPDAVRHEMEGRLGADFSDVRLHVDAQATRAASELDARAYTVRSHIVFGSGEFSPHTFEGRRLLAHELVHVVQQRNGASASTDAAEVVPADDPTEREADRVAVEVSGITDATTSEGAAGNGAEGGAHAADSASSRDTSVSVHAADAAPSPAGHVQRVPFGEWWARHILGEGDFSDKELRDYLTFLKGGSIEDNNDSDNKARVIVGRWAGGGMKLDMNPPLATLLIKEMQSGFTGDDDELAILEILEHMSNETLKVIFTSIGVEDLNSDFHGAEWDMLQDFYRRRFKGGMATMLKGVLEPMGQPLPLGTRRGEVPMQKIADDQPKQPDQPVDQPDEARCQVKFPERCPTYESWLHQFKGVPTFRSITGHQVLGSEKEKAPKETATDLSADPSKRRPASVVGQGEKERRSYLPTDRFIDGPTEAWVRENLPPNLLKSAYEVPCDCADVAVILRHVWLAAHHRTEVHKTPGDPKEWTLGSAAGEARREQIRVLILTQIGSGLEGMLNPYVNEKGEPLRRFSDLEPLLHAGDVLVWDHEEGTGHVQTLFDVVRDDSGHITNMPALQGNQPVGKELAKHLLEKDKEEQAKKKPADRQSAPTVDELRKAPGRRIESSTVDVPLPKHRDEPVWGWHDKERTFLVAAGPPAGASRPKQQVVKGQKVPRRPTDWASRFDTASLETMDSIFETMLLDFRAAMERKSNATDDRSIPEVTDDDGRTLGQAAGKRLASLLAKSGDLQTEGSSLHRLERMRATIGAVRQTTCVRGASESTANEKTTRGCSLTPYDALDRALVEAARGISSVDFKRKADKNERVVNVLLTGFDPFNPDVDKPVRAGDWNPSGAAVRQLDGQTVPVDAKVKAAVEGVVLPVSFPEFRGGLVESIVDQHRDADAILTVSLDPNLEPNDPVRLEQFAVGVHAGGASQPAEATPTATGAPGTPSMFEARGDVSGIAADTARKKTNRESEVLRPNIGTTITLEFTTVATADDALKALGETPQGDKRVKLTSVAAIRQIASNMRQEGTAGGTRFSFTAKGQTFSASLVSGPGGSFLSNEVSFRVLRRLSEQGRSDTISFHTHVSPGTSDTDEIPQATTNAVEQKTRNDALKKARDVLTNLVSTLKRLIAAVGKRVGGSKTSTKP